MSRGNQTRTKKHGANKNRRVTTAKPDLARQEHGAKPIITGPSGQANYAEITAHKMDAFKKGQLHNAAGKPVGRPNQALNIARREARLAGARDVPVEGKAEKTKRGERERRGFKDVA
jgi:hypothetical protein